MKYLILVITTLALAGCYVGPDFGPRHGGFERGPHYDYHYDRR